MFVSETELMRISKRVQRSAIIRWLVREKIAFRLDADGFPLVTEAALEPPGVKATPTRKAKGPNLGWLNHGKTP